MKIKKPKIQHIDIEVTIGELSAIYYAINELNKEKDSRFIYDRVEFRTPCGVNEFSKDDINHVAQISGSFLDTYN